MVRYRRNRLSGGTFFFTVTLADRRAQALTDHIGALRAAFRSVRREAPFQIPAIVVLPDHLHAIWTLPEEDADYPGRWRAIKSRFTRALKARGVALASDSSGGYRLWQHRYWEHTIRDEIDMQRHVDYIHFNPVKHGHVKRPADWPYSSFHRYIHLGWLPAHWAADPKTLDGGAFGE